MSLNSKIWDAAIVGGGPAGLAAAIALRQRGLCCVVVDAIAPPIDKACGEGLMPEAIESLARLGIELGANDGIVVRGIQFANEVSKSSAAFARGVGLGVRRTRLHARMVRRAEEAGVELLWGKRAELVPDGHMRVDGAELQARWMIGADGQMSRFRPWAGLDRVRTSSTRYGFRRHYRCQPWSEYIEVYWGPRAQLYVTPVGADEICIAVLTSDARLRTADALLDFPQVEAKLRGAAFTTRDRGSATTTRKVARVYRGSRILLGDASGSVDAITGEGLAAAFQQALALADAVAQDDPAAYQAEHRRIAWRPRAMAHAMLLMDRYPSLQQRALGVFASDPDEFSRLLAVHVGQASLPKFVLRHGTAFAWRMLAAKRPKPSEEDAAASAGILS